MRAVALAAFVCLALSIAAPAAEARLGVVPGPLVAHTSALIIRDSNGGCWGIDREGHPHTGDMCTPILKIVVVLP